MPPLPPAPPVPVEIAARTALVRSRIPGVEFVINPYIGCGHGCRYCYAVFMARYSKHHEHAPWGSFVEAKTNIVEVLRGELARRRRTGTAMLSSVCDPYQPAEQAYRLTRGCVEALREHGWGIRILTRSPLVTRDIDVLRLSIGASVGFSIPTDDDRVRQVLEPAAPSIEARVEALRQVHAAGIHTWVFVAPMLPMNPARLAALIGPHIDELMIDALNYRDQVEMLFRQQGWQHALSTAYASETRAELLRLLGSASR